MPPQPGPAPFSVAGRPFHVHPEVYYPYYSRDFLHLQVLPQLAEAATACCIGAGSGFLPVVWAHRHPQLAITATDINPAAVDNMVENVRRHELDGRIDVRPAGDLFDCVPANRHFDVLVFNGPHLDCHLDLTSGRTPAQALTDEELEFHYRQSLETYEFTSLIDPQLATAKRFFRTVGQHMRARTKRFPGSAVLYTFSDFASPRAFLDLLDTINQNGLVVTAVHVDFFGRHRLVPSDDFLKLAVGGEIHSKWLWYNLEVRSAKDVRYEEWSQAFNRANEQIGAIYFSRYEMGDYREFGNKLRKMTRAHFHQLGSWFAARNGRGTAAPVRGRNPEKPFIVAGFVFSELHGGPPSYEMFSNEPSLEQSETAGIRLDEVVRMLAKREATLLADFMRKDSDPIFSKVEARSCGGCGEGEIMVSVPEGIPGTAVFSVAPVKGSAGVSHGDWAALWNEIVRSGRPDPDFGSAPQPSLDEVERLKDLYSNFLLHFTHGRTLTNHDLRYIRGDRLSFSGATRGGCTYIFTDSTSPSVYHEDIWSIGIGVDKLVQMFVHRYHSNRHAAKSSLASIMARNGSHNLGSHVLGRIASAGKDVARAFVDDVQVCARYVQQRMDFVAQISTTWPGWSQSAFMVEDLLREFLNQFILLEFIAASEGLRAHRYRPHESLPARSEGGRIRIHVFSVPRQYWEAERDCDMGVLRSSVEPMEADAVLECLGTFARGEGTGAPILLTRREGDDSQSGQAVLSRDPARRIALSIPGGRVGWHAFYVILENVIRNAAKHGWSRRRQGTNEEGVLDVIIEVCERLREKEEYLGITVKDGERLRKLPAWLVRIYDNVSDLSGGLRLWSDDRKAPGVNNRLQAALVGETGEMKRENWGLAEMRIAAGYLQQRDIALLGGGATDLTGPPPAKDGPVDTVMLESAKGPDGSPHVLRAVRSPIGTLGYEFFVREPRIVGIHGDLGRTWTSAEREKWSAASVYLQAQAGDTDFEYYVLCAPDRIGSLKEDEPSDIFLRVLYCALYEDTEAFLCAHAAQVNDLRDWLGLAKDQDNELLTPLSWLKIAIERYPYRLFVALPDSHDWRGPEGISPESDRWSPRPDLAFLYKRICWIKQDDIPAHSSEENDVLFTLLRRWIWHLKERVRGDRQIEELRLSLNLSVGETRDDALPEAQGIPAPSCSSPFVGNQYASAADPVVSVTADSIRWGEGFNGERRVYSSEATLSRHVGAREGEGPGFPLHERYYAKSFRPHPVRPHYAEAVSGANRHMTSLAAFAESGMDSSVAQRKDVLEYLEQTLVRMSIFDERLQESFQNLPPRLAAWIADQLVWLGFVGAPGHFNQPSRPAHGIFEILPISTPATEQRVGTSGFPQAGIHLRDILEPVPNYEGAAAPPGFENSFCSDCIIMHQGILDKWDDAAMPGESRHDRKHRLTAQVLRWKDRKPFVLVTSGRGRPDDIPHGAKFLPLSSLPAQLVGRSFEKHAVWAISATVKETLM